MCVDTSISVRRNNVQAPLRSASSVLRASDRMLIEVTKVDGDDDDDDDDGDDDDSDEGGDRDGGWP